MREKKIADDRPTTKKESPQTPPHQSLFLTPVVTVRKNTTSTPGCCEGFGGGCRCND